MYCDLFPRACTKEIVLVNTIDAWPVISQVVNLLPGMDMLGESLSCFAAGATNCTLCGTGMFSGSTGTREQ